MASTLAQLVRKVMTGFPRTDGEAILAVKQAINDAHRAIAMVRDFDELLVLDTTSAATVDGTSRYHITSDLLLTRPKDIYSIVLHDDENSRKLTYVPYRELDKVVPYPDMVGEGRPYWYTRQGYYLEFFRIPDAAYDLYIRHSQWPAILDSDDDTTPYLYLDEVIVFLAKDIANAYLSNQYLDFTERASYYLKLAVRDNITQPDHDLVARPFTVTGPVHGEYWNNPFVRRDP
jgi:hypothetical protein